MTFLRQNVQIICCAIKSHQLRSRCKVTKALKEYARVKILGAIQRYNYRKKTQRKRTAQSAGIITSLFRRLRDEIYYNRSRHAAIVIQRYSRQYLARMKKKILQFEKASKHIYIINGDVSEVIHAIFYNSSIVMSWRRFLVALILYPLTKEIHIKRIQMQWTKHRQRVRLRKIEIYRKGVQWINSITALHKYKIKTQWKGAIVIQRMFYQHRVNIVQRYLSRVLEKIRLVQKSKIKIALFLQTQWRSKLSRCTLDRRRKKHVNNLAKIQAATILQTWYRGHKSAWIYNFKLVVTVRWLNVSKRLLRMKRLDDQKHISEGKRRFQAALVVHASISTFFRKHQAQKRLKSMQEISAAIHIQEFWKLKRIRIEFIRALASVVKIQRKWRASKCRSLILEVYKKEKSRRLTILAKEKKALCEQRIQRQIIALLNKQEDNAALKIQSYFRHFIELKQKEKEIQLQKDLVAEQLAIEEAKLKDILRRKEEQKKLKTVTTKYLKRLAGKVQTVSTSVQNVTSLNIIHKVRDRKRVHNERLRIAAEVLRYDRLKRASRGAKAIPNNKLVSEYRNHIRERFGDTKSWFDRKCETVMFRYLLWPEDILSLRRCVSH